MATHNDARLVGYLKKDPLILNADSEGEEKILCTLRVVNRELDGYHQNPFQDVILYYDGKELNSQIKKLKAYDLIDVKGVVNVLNMYKRSVCPDCGEENIKKGTFFGVYPMHITKLNALKTVFEHDDELPDQVLMKHFKKVSNRVLVLGNVNTTPEMTGTEKSPCCRYRLFVERKYYIASQDEVTVDHPYIYSYGKQGRNDQKYLKIGSLVLADCFIRSRNVKSNMKCSHCGKDYQFPDIASELIPYNVEYFRGYYTEEEATEMEKEKNRQAVKAVLG